MSVLYHCYILLFIFYIGHFYTGSMGTSASFIDFYRSEVLEGNICLPQNVLFDAGRVTTRIKCAVLCKKTKLCFGIFYDPVQGRCTGCSYFLNTTTLVQTGTTFYGRKGYEINMEKLTWTQAKENCTSRGGRLASINTELEQDFVSQIIDTISNGGDLHVWIGGSDLSTEGMFVWEDGTAFFDTAFTYWLSGQPNDYLNQDCIHLDKKNGMWGWNDESCSAKFTSLCELNQ